MPNRSTSPSTSARIQLVADVWCSTLKSQLDLELRGGRTIAGVTARSALRLLAASCHLSPWCAPSQVTTE